MERVDTTFYEDFTIAEHFGDVAIEDTYDRAFDEWKTNYKYFTEFVIALNEKCWDWHYAGNSERSKMYADMFYEAQNWAYENFTKEELDYFYEITD